MQFVQCFSLGKDILANAAGAPELAIKIGFYLTSISAPPY
jgi:hypothetical protein